MPARHWTARCSRCSRPAGELVAAIGGEREVSEASVYSENEEAEIQERLRALGYE